MMGTLKEEVGFEFNLKDQGSHCVSYQKTMLVSFTHDADFSLKI